MSTLPHETLAKIEDCLFCGQKIEAIKLFRQSTGAGLADAKTAVERLEADLRAESPERFVASAKSAGDASRQARLLGWVFLGVGTIAALVGVGIGAYSLSLLLGSAAVEGTVVRLDENIGGDERTWYPVVEYQVDGNKYCYTGVGSNPPRYTAGQVVPVLYKVGRPDVARIDSFLDLWFVPLMFGGVGAIFAGIGAWVVRRNKPLSPNQV
jgi:hypothetical protein